MDVSLAGWLGFAVVVLGILGLDLGLMHRSPKAIGWREALAWSLVWFVVSLGFAGFVWFRAGSEPALQFLAGYVIEKSLSIDNIFVFLLCFQYFAVPPQYQHKVLFWGVLGALAMRAVMVGVGVSLLHSFHWLTYVFGAFLVVTGVKLAWNQGEQTSPEQNLMVRLTRRFVRITPDYQGDRLLVRQGGLLWGTPLLLVLICVEATDLVFAVDSIPAILAVTDDPFIVYTSNVFALLGMRALYFAVQGLLLKLRFLHYGLASILVFVGFKMATVDFVQIPIAVALAVICGILTVATLLSLWLPETESAEPEGCQPAFGDVTE